MQEASVHASAVNQAKGDHIPWGWVVITAVGLVVAVTLAAFVWVGIYSYLIHPGEDLSYYQNYAQFASPIVSVVVGIPVWFFACRWVGRKAGTRAVAMCLSAWLIVPVIDIPLSLLGQAKAYDWAMVALSNSTKLLAAYLGGRAALKYVLGMRRVSPE
ncbi:MAG: hypothetical protein ND866_13065 [Pyrinomonadaceae bacterium]|nr:hypothetical protein [Pyrinomonadaceae bacterium]